MSLVFKHYKGGIYRLVTLATCEKTKVSFTVYQSLEKSRPTWLRPSEEFFENILKEDGSLEPRFKLIDIKNME